ncbi:MAG: hypothetical protein V4686_02595 [Patescibacteria group bacterium]
MENTPIPNQAPFAQAPVVKDNSTKKMVIYTILLALATIFWIWSLKYNDTTPMMENDQAIATTTISGTSEESDLEDEIDASLDSQAELELKGIDEEF